MYEPPPLPPLIASRPFAVATARGLGVSRRRLRGADLSSPFHGVRQSSATDGGRARASEDETEDARRLRQTIARCHAYAVRMRPGDFFSHVTAAVLWGCPLPRTSDTRVHVSSVAPRRAPAGAGVVGHRLSPEATRIVIRHGVPVSDAATTWCDLAGLLTRSDARGTGEVRGLDDLIAAGDHLVLTPKRQSVDVRPFLTLQHLDARLAQYDRRGVRAARFAHDLVRDGAESRPETLVRLAIVRAGLPEPLLNQNVFGDDGGFIGRADMIYPRYRVIVEYDGQQHRTDDAQYAKDAVRIEGFHTARHAVVRIRKEGLCRLAREVLRVERALRRVGWPTA